MRVLLPGIISGLLIMISFSCKNNTNIDLSSNPSETETTLISKRVLPAILENGLKAHDPEGTWPQMESLEFSINEGEKKETHLFNLHNRHALITASKHQIGFDGHDVWVAPNKEVYTGNARFYYSVYFYFFAMPYVLADPGIKYKVLPPEEYFGIKYNPLSITYNAGVGDAPDDEYIAYFDQETNKMELLFYTVTYNKGGPGDKFSVWRYSEWQNVDGLSLPKTMTRYKMVDGQLELQDATRTFYDVKISSEAPDEKMFQRPAESVIDAG